MFKIRSSFSRLTALVVAILLMAFAHPVHAQQTLPEGTKGWWYYTGVNSPGRYAPDPITACKKNAANQMGTPLLAMRPAGDSGGVMSCKYAHFIGSPNDGEWYGTTILVCNPGYFAKSPGVCVKHNEAPAPAPGGRQAVAQVAAALVAADQVAVPALREGTPCKWQVARKCRPKLICLQGRTSRCALTAPIAACTRIGKDSRRGRLVVFVRSGFHHRPGVVQ